MKHFSAKILAHAAVSDSFHELTFAWDEDASVPSPGQFCTLRVSQGFSPLLRRPFAFSGFDEKRGIASIIYKRRGPATEILSAHEKGDSIDVIGPLGTGFTSMPGYPFASLICVAGGTGFGPMLFLAASVARSGAGVQMILGCRTKAQLPVLAPLDALSPVITTDDGSQGRRGTPLDCLAELTKEKVRGATVCVCGPSPLLKGCHDWARTRNLVCYVSLEQIMACGVGACMGCAVKVKDASFGASIGASGSGYVRACTEGPVFNSERIVWT
jgi:dihydroorotate dehydrogenase electron transfer subunit